MNLQRSVILVVVALFLTAFSVLPLRADEACEQKAVAAAQDWLSLVDEGRYAESWDAVPSDSAEGAPPGFYRHGFEIVVGGSYSGLVAYLERLEALPWHLNWVEATLDAAGRPDLRLTLTVHTLSLEEAWLRV